MPEVGIIGRCYATAMPSGSLTLSDLPPGDATLTCQCCARSASYPVAHLVADMGGDTALPDALRLLTALWCRGERGWADEGCRARWDRLPSAGG